MSATDEFVIDSPDYENPPRFMGFESLKRSANPITAIRFDNVKLDPDFFIEELSKLDTSRLQRIELKDIHLEKGTFPSRVFLPSLTHFTFDNERGFWGRREWGFDWSMLFFHKTEITWSPSSIWDLGVNISIKWRPFTMNDMSINIDHDRKSLQMSRFPEYTEILSNVTHKNVRSLSVTDIYNNTTIPIAAIPKSLYSLTLAGTNLSWPELTAAMDELDNLTSIAFKQQCAPITISKLPPNLKHLTIAGASDIDVVELKNAVLDMLILCGCRQLSPFTAKYLRANKILLFGSGNQQFLDIILENGFTEWVFFETTLDTMKEKSENTEDNFGSKILKPFINAPRRMSERHIIRQRGQPEMLELVLARSQDSSTWKARGLFLGEKQFLKEKYFSEICPIYTSAELSGNCPSTRIEPHHDEFMTYKLQNYRQLDSTSEAHRFKDFGSTDQSFIKTLVLSDVTIHVEDLPTIWNKLTSCIHLDIGSTTVSYPIIADDDSVAWHPDFYPRTLKTFEFFNFPPALKSLTLRDMKLRLPTNGARFKLTSLTISNCDLNRETFAEFHSSFDVQQVVIEDEPKESCDEEYTRLNHDVLMSILKTNAEIVLLKGFDFKSDCKNKSEVLDVLAEAGLEGWAADFVLARGDPCTSWTGIYLEGIELNKLINMALDGKMLKEHVKLLKTDPQQCASVTNNGNQAPESVPNNATRNGKPNLDVNGENGISCGMEVDDNSDTVIKRRKIQIEREMKKKTNTKIPSTITFRVSDETPIAIETTKWANYNPIEMNDHVGTRLVQYKKHGCTRVLQGTTFPCKIHPDDNGFVHSIVNAYNGHHNIVIRPDDVWIAIAIQFSFFVNANAEEFRGKFVNFSGKKELVVFINGVLNNAPYDEFVDLMTEEIHKNIIDDEVKDWFLPDFTTTVPDDIITCGVVLMASMKKYFDYKCCLMCGIPFVTLEGTAEDWSKIYSKLKKLRSYNLNKWVDMLEPIIGQFIEAVNGKPDLGFWQKICHYQSGGSGPTWLSGWVTAFTVFTEKGKWQGDVSGGKKWPKIDFNYVASGNVEVDVLIDDNGVAEYPAVMFAGHMASEVLEDGFTIQPKSGWVMALKPDKSTRKPKISSGDADESTLSCFEGFDGNDAEFLAKFGMGLAEISNVFIDAKLLKLELSRVGLDQIQSINLSNVTLCEEGFKAGERVSLPNLKTYILKFPNKSEAFEENDIEADIFTERTMNRNVPWKTFQKYLVFDCKQLGELWAKNINVLVTVGERKILQIDHDRNLLISTLTNTNEILYRPNSIEILGIDAELDPIIPNSVTVLDLNCQIPWTELEKSISSNKNIRKLSFKQDWISQKYCVNLSRLPASLKELEFVNIHVGIEEGFERQEFHSISFNSCSFADPLMFESFGKYFNPEQVRFEGCTGPQFSKPFQILQTLMGCTDIKVIFANRSFQVHDQNEFIEKLKSIGLRIDEVEEGEFQHGQFEKREDGMWVWYTINSDQRVLPTRSEPRLDLFQETK